MADKRFTWMHSGQLGAPQMNGAAGSNGQMLQVLDACLIDGFNPQTVTIATKTALTVTLTFGVSHGYELSQIIAVSGATDAVLNGNHRIASKTTNTVTIDAAGVAVTTGTIVTKVAPLGWQSIFGVTDPLKRAYRSNNMQSSKTVLYLDMTIPASSGYNAANPVKRAMVDMCENMTALGTQINSYTSVFNNRPAIRNGKMFWYQCRDGAKNSPVTTTANRSWVIVGSDTCFYLFNDYRATDDGTTQRDTYFFGDMLEVSGSETISNCGWIGAVNANDAEDRYALFIGGTLGGELSDTVNTKGFMTKAFNGSGTLNPLVLSADGSDAPHFSGAEGLVSNFPNPANQSIIGLSVYSLTAQHLRAKLPALRYIPQNMSARASEFDKLAINDTVIVAVGSNYTVGFFALDLRG